MRELSLTERGRWWRSRELANRILLEREREREREVRGEREEWVKKIGGSHVGPTSI
jgi:hypothetical protein